MNVFELLIFSCVTYGGWPLDSYTKTCSWRSTGDLFTTKAACAAVGAAQLGHPIFGDIAEDRKVENTNCAERQVRDQ